MPKLHTPSRLTSNAIAKGGARILRSRRLMRTPIWLYKARLGFLFGSRMLMLEHTGRKSGAQRYVVLEVFGHPAPDTYIVLSGFGDRAQWFRNVQANSHVRISTAGHTSAVATARTLGTEEAHAALDEYAARHRRAWETFRPVIETTLGASIGDHGTEIPMVQFTLDRNPTRA